MACFSSLVRTEWEEFARSRPEIGEPALVSRQGWAWEDEMRHLPSLVRGCEPHAGAGIPGEPWASSIPLSDASVLGASVGALESSRPN